MSIPRCVHISLIRLQEIWLTKFLTTGLVIRGMAILRDELPTESGSIVADIGIYMVYVLVSSGHLPLINFVLLLAVLGQGLVARVAWAQKNFRAQHVQNVAAPVVEIARLLSLVVHLASIAGDPSMLAFACAYILMLITTKCLGMTRAATVDEITK